MNIFYLAFMPVFYWAVQSQFVKSDVRILDIIKPFLLGFVIGVPMQLLYWAFDVYFQLNWNAPGVYFFTFFNKEGFIYFPFAAILFLFYRTKDDGAFYIREMLGLFTGYFFLFAFVDVISENALTSYELIYLSLVRLMMLLTASALLNRAIAYKGKKKIYLLGGLVALPFVFNFLPLFFLLNKLLIFHLILIPLLLSVLVLFYMELGNKLPE